MTDWQSLISDTAVQVFTRTGRLDRFRLARGDLAELAGQVMKQDPTELRREWDRGQGFLGIRVQVHCAPLDRAVVVDEWVRE